MSSKRVQRDERTPRDLVYGEEFRDKVYSTSRRRPAFREVETLELSRRFLFSTSSFYRPPCNRNRLSVELSNEREDRFFELIGWNASEL